MIKKKMNINVQNDLIEIGRIRQYLAIMTRRAATDKDFRALCLEDVSRAYFELAGQALPEQYAVRN